MTFVITDAAGRIYEQATPGAFTIEAGVVKPMELLPVTLYYGKANCYRTASAGTLEIDVTPYYSLAGDYTYENRPRVNINGELVDKAVSATVLWRQTNSSSSGDVLSAVPALEGTTLKVPVSGVKGNALVAIRDASGKNVWSFHIWVTEASDLTYINEERGTFKMMDRNLGATSAELWNSDTDSKDAHGLFYQWGRKDPLIGPSSENATSIAVVYDKDNNTIEPTDWATTTTPITRDDIAKYPMTIYGGASGISENWFAEDACDLWGSSVMYAVDGAEGKGAGEKSIYDPCPPGYRVPHPYVWSTFTSEPGGGKHKTAGFTTTIDGGIKTLQNTTGATFSSTYVYPATGFIAYTASFATGPALQRLSKGLANVGINNWSNAANAANRGARFFFDNGGCSTPAGNPRAYGYCVRCMKDTK